MRLPGRCPCHPVASVTRLQNPSPHPLSHRFVAGNAAAAHCARPPGQAGSRAGAAGGDRHHCHPLPADKPHTRRGHPASPDTSRHPQASSMSAAHAHAMAQSRFRCSRRAPNPARRYGRAAGVPRGAFAQPMQHPQSQQSGEAERQTHPRRGAQQRLQRAASAPNALRQPATPGRQHRGQAHR